jgi:hypothetical protein
MNDSDNALACAGKLRRLALFGNAAWNGIDFLEVADDQLSLCVHFFGKVPASLGAANIRIEGGRRVRCIRAIAVHVDRSDDPQRDDCLRIDLDKFGDFSQYRLCLVEANGRPLAGLDPRYACLEFSFKTGCPGEFDCVAAPPCEPDRRAAPEINYLAKDYQSFRQLLLDRLALTLPDWRERHVPDLGLTLVELLAYSADMLSYYQDAVATEAYLDTARQRISVRRHVRLLDYLLHEGCNARAWVVLDVAAEHAQLPADAHFATAPRDRRSYQPLTAADIDLYQAHNTITIHTWGDNECCLRQGATRATLLDQARPAGKEAAVAHKRILHLRVGDVLIFEEVLGPVSGKAPDRDLAHRHAVRLTRVAEAEDGLLHLLVLEVEWAPADALPFALCLSVRLAAPDCRLIGDISVARGNVVLVEHGVPVDEDCGAVEEGASIGDCACEGSIVDVTPLAKPFEIALRQSPLSHRAPLAPRGPASLALRQDPRLAVPLLWLSGAPAGANPDDANPAWRWEARPDLLGSGGEDQHFVAEIDDDGVARLRFGDGEMGAQPPPGMRFRAHYRVGNGPDGNGAAETIHYIVYRTQVEHCLVERVRNPLPAQGGIAPEPANEAKLFAPDAFRQVLARAVTADDYAALAERDPRIERADAHLRWNGSWYEACVALDPYGREDADAALRRQIARQLFPFRRIGHDLSVRAAQYIAIELTLEVCVLAHFLRAHVAAALADALSNRRLADGTLGFFHPDRLSFGGVIAVSAIVGVAQAIEGVDSACVAALQRFGEPPDGELEHGLLRLAPGQIAQLDNDADFPEHGKLTLLMRGGR